MTTRTRQPPKGARWGRGILLAVTVLLMLNGLAWLFVGPEAEVDAMAAALGLPTSELQETHPVAADFVAGQARQVAVWFMAFGLLSFLAIVAASRRGAHWARTAPWVVVAAPAAVGMAQLVGGGAWFGYAMLTLGAIAFVGQLLARTDTESPGAGRTSRAATGDQT